MPYYEYEWLLEDIQNEQKRLEDQRKKDEQARNAAMPKIPKAPAYKPPKLPKITLPKF